MADNETKIRLTAVDGVSAVLNNIKGKTGEVESSLKKLAAVSLGGLSLAGLASSVQTAIKAAAAMEELSQKTGIATDKLSALDYAFRREGVSTDSFAKAVKELSKNMIEAGDASSKTGKLFAELGVNSRGDTREALLKIADTFKALPDGATKAALAVNLFGKAGLDLIPALNNGAEGIRQIEEQARKLGITFDSETGRAAKKFSDDMFALSESTKKLGTSLATQLLPSFTNITGAMREAAEAGGLLQAVWVGLGGLGNLIFNGTEVNQAKAEIEGLTKTIADLEEEVARREGKGVDGLIKALDELNPKLEAAKKRLAELTTLPAVPQAPAGDKDRERAIAKILGGDGAKAAIDAFEKSLASLQNKLDAVSSGFSADFAPSVEILNKALEKGAISLERHEDLMAKLVKQQPLYKAGLEAQAKLEESVAKALADGAQERRRQLESIQESIARRREENETFGMTEEQIALLTIARLEERLAILQASGAMEDELANLAEEIELRKQLRDQIGRGEGIRQAQAQAAQDLQNQLSLWDEVSDRGARFFYDLALNGKDAFKSLKEGLRSFAAELIALFAKRWILQLGANLTGNTALSALAGNAGQGSLAGTLLSSGGSLLASGLGSLGLGSASQFVGGMTGVIAGPALPGSALAAGQTAGGYLAAAGPYVAAIVAAYMLYSAFKDKGENWKGRIGFGNMANAYSTDGVFGREGFQYLAGDDAVNRSIQQFFASTKPLDQQIAKRLTPAQIANITGRLTAYNTSGTRADGQPAEFAFGKGDDTAAAQLSLEYVKQKYGAIFDEIDTEFAAFIRGYTGKAEDLLKAIGDFAGVLDGLDTIGFKGLDLKALKGFQKEGEELGQTFARIAQQFSEYQNLFLTDSEKLALVQKSVADGFKELGIEAPKSTEEFKKLVSGLDLSTEEGRKLFEGLMKLAPAFATVANAADQMLASFDQIASRRNPALGKFILEGQLEEAVRKFMARNPWTQGMDWRTVAQQIGLITSYPGGRADFAGYSPEDQALILKILGITDDLEGLGDAASSAAQTLGSLQTNAQAAAQSWTDIKLSLWDFLRGLYTDKELSPLDPAQQLDTLKSRFSTTLAQAKSGNIGAGQSLPALIEQLLQAGRAQFGSTGSYLDLFEWVTRLAGDFVQPGGGMELERLAYEEQKRQSNLMARTNEILAALYERMGTTAAYVADATIASGEQVASAYSDAAASTVRR